VLLSNEIEGVSGLPCEEKEYFVYISYSVICVPQGLVLSPIFIYVFFLNHSYSVIKLQLCQLYLVKKRNIVLSYTLTTQ